MIAIFIILYVIPLVTLLLIIILNKEQIKRRRLRKFLSVCSVVPIANFVILSIFIACLIDEFFHITDS